MELSVDEESILDGESGEGRRKAMEIITTLGEIFEAERLLPITSAQVSGVSYKNLGEAGLGFIRGLAKDCKVSVRTTLNPAGIDLENWKEMGVDKGFAEKQDEVIKTYARLGITTSCSCTPYHDINRPNKGDHLAWGESSAVNYVNSVLGARTNREGGPSALASAIIGKTPYFGLHLEENRRAGVIVEVEEGVSDIASLGYHVGVLVKDQVPYFRGIATPDQEELKSLSAALAASGAVALYHIEDLTPEASTALIEDGKDLEIINVSKTDVEETAASLTITDKEVELVAIGCPHVSPKGLEDIANILKDKVPNEDGPDLWICTSRCSKDASKQAVEVIERFGLVLSDTCMVVSPIEGLYKVTATSSAKAAHYLAMDTYGNQEVRYGPLEDLLALVYRGDHT